MRKVEELGIELILSVYIYGVYLESKVDLFLIWFYYEGI